MTCLLIAALWLLASLVTALVLGAVVHDADEHRKPPP